MTANEFEVGYDRGYDDGFADASNDSFPGLLTLAKEARTFIAAIAPGQGDRGYSADLAGRLQAAISEAERRAAE